MCELRDAEFVMACDIDGNYKNAIYLYCCNCGKSTPPIKEFEPFCDRCCKKLHRPSEANLLLVDITVCGRCRSAIRGVIPQPMCHACQSIINFEGYNDKYYENRSDG